MNQLPYVEMSQQYGGNGGNPFNPQHEIDFNPNLRVQKIRVRHGGMIDSIQFVLTDGMNLYELPKLGGNGGTQSEWDVPYGEYITKITVRYNQYCCGLQFFTNTGKFSPFFGKQIGNTADVDIKGNLLSYGGRSGSLVDAIQFFYWS